MRRHYPARNFLKILQIRFWQLELKHRSLIRWIGSEVVPWPGLKVHAYADAAFDVVEAAGGLEGEVGGDEGDAFVGAGGGLGEGDAVDVVLDGWLGGRHCRGWRVDWPLIEQMIRWRLEKREEYVGTELIVLAQETCRWVK